jgi:hypothetical protein
LSLEKECDDNISTVNSVPVEIPVITDTFFLETTYHFILIKCYL